MLGLGEHKASELNIRPEDIRAALDDAVKAFEPAKANDDAVGRVISAADGIARVEGLPGTMANELLTFANGVSGLALNLDER